MEILKYTEDHRRFRERLNLFLEKEITPHVDQWEKEGIVPRNVWKKMGQEGFLCPAVSSEYGGLGGNFLYSLIVAEEMAGTNHYGLAANLHSDIAVPFIETYAPEKLRKKYLPKCVSGEIVTAIAITEPNAGSDMAAMRTSAREEGGEIVIDGTKTFISNGINSDLVILAALDSSVKKGHQPISLYLVEAGTPGFEKGKHLKKMGWQSQDTAELFFSGCRIPAENRLGKKGTGLFMLMHGLQQERLIISVMAVAAAEQILEATVRHCRETSVSGIPLSASQATRFALAEMATETKLGKTFVHKLAADHMEGKNAVSEISMAKYWTTEMVSRVADRCLDLHGDSAMLEKCPVVRRFRDVRVMSIFGGTTETMKNLVAEFMGLDTHAPAVSDEASEKRLDFWRKHLKGCPALLDIPTDRRHPPVRIFRKARQNFRIAPELLSQLGSMCKDAELPLSDILMSAFVTLLSRHSRQEDIVVGMTISDNILPIRTDLSGNPGFRELAEQVGKTKNQARRHGNIPFELLIRELEPEPEPSRTPLFQAMFSFQDIVAEVGNISTDPVDLMLMMRDGESGLDGILQYNAELFDAATIERMTGHYLVLLRGAAENPNLPVSELPLLTEAEKHQILTEWNDTQADYPDDKCIHQIFEEQAAETPDALAVVFENEALTYGELNARANQLAHYLRKMGAGPEVLVGICVERSPEMVVGLLGILKAGGAYVPLDPAYPHERLRYMLEDTRTPILLTQKRLLGKIPNRSSGQTVCLDSDWETISQEKDENPNSGVRPANLVYVIYTSGSTGKPKGVMIAHQGLCNLALVQIKLFNLEANNCILQFFSFSFDGSIWEIIMAICSGARLYIGTQDSLIPETILDQLIYQQTITHVTMPPSALALMPIKPFPSLHFIIVAGEACPSDLIAKWSEKRCFINAYGPSESSVCATATECLRNSQKAHIGYPISNTQIYILNPCLHPLSIRIPGEIHIGGVGLARGYHNRPDLTAEKFIPNPFSGKTGECLYKTGDLACFLPDGNIEFLGRIDHQVKIRGFRIELGEIETAISKYKEFKENVVIVREDHPGDKQLVAYIVPFPKPDRIPYQTECLLETAKEKMELHTENISSGGICLVGMSDFSLEGETVFANLRLPGNKEKGRFKGRVVWQKEQRTGIDFDLSDDEAEQVGRSIEYLTENQKWTQFLQQAIRKELRDYLRQKLPDYMIPSAFVFMESPSPDPERQNGPKCSPPA